MHVNLDVNFVDKIVNEVKSQGVFDQFRKDSMSDVDTKPAYQNLRQRVENSVSKYLSEQKWTPETNKNQLRERLRSNLMTAGFLDVGVQRIVDQVVNPKISTVFQPKIEDIVYKYLGIEKPEPKIDEKILPMGLNGNLTIKTDSMDLLPNDLEAVSPDSEKSTVKSEPRSESKMDITNDLEDDDDDDESPPFEPLEGVNLIKIKDDENSNISVMSGLSGLASQDSNKIKTEQNNTPVINSCLEMSQESQLSQVSSNSHLSIVTNEEGLDKTVNVLVKKEETNVDISEEAQMPKFNENSNSCSTVSAEKLHFDIKKDEIKFEGTDRNIEQNISVEQNSSIDSPEKIIKNESSQLNHSNDEISNATLNTENSSYFDDDSEKCLQIVEEPTESSQISQINSPKNIPENNVALYDNLTESNETLKTNSSLTDKHNDNISPNKTNENLEISKKPAENIIKNNDLKKSDNLKSEDSNDMPLPPPSNNNCENKSSSINTQSKERDHSSSSNSSRHFSHKKHSKDKKSDKDKTRKTSSTNDSKKHSSSNSSDNINKHSSSRHSSQSSSRSLTSSTKDKDNKSSSSHKSKHYSKDEKSSRNDRDRKKDKNNSNRDEKSSKTNKEKSKETVIDDHNLARIKTYRRKSTDSNDGDTPKDVSVNKITKNGSEKTEKSSVTNNNNNISESGTSMDKVNDSNLSNEKCENLSKPIIVDNLNNIELVIGANININNDIPTDIKSLSDDNNIIKSKDVVLEMNEIISPTKFLNENDDLLSTVNNEDDTDSSISINKHDKIDIESDEIELEYFEITHEEEQNFTDLMNRYVNLLGKMFHANEFLNELCNKNNNITTNSLKSKSTKMDNKNEKSFKKVNSVLPIITDTLNGKRKRKIDSTITHTITTDDSQSIIDNTLSIGCFQYDYNVTKRMKTNNMNILLTAKVSPTPSEMSTGSKENDFSDKNTNKTSVGKILRLDERDFNDTRKNGGTPSVKGTQRYSSDDLYKPRPILSQRSRRRAMDGDI